jgi:hypothetical protein
MSAEHIHSKIIASAARTELSPLGLKRKGRSRTWLDDRNWWIGVVEFQPSSYSRGTYLNVAAHWLWNPGAHLTYGYGGRVLLPEGEHHGQWFEFESEEQFQPVARRVAAVAGGRVEQFRILFCDPATAASTLDADNPPLVQSLDAGVAYGLAGRPEAARACFQRYLDWCDSEPGRRSPNGGRQQRVNERYKIVGDTAQFREHIAAEIHAGRTALGLDPTTELRI